MIESTPRNVAVMALRDRQGNVTQSLRTLLAERDLSPVDRAFTRELALGALRRRGTLEAVLAAFCRHSDRRPPGAIGEILHVAAYQLLFLDRVPDFAAVDEAVSQAGAFRHKRQAGFVNGVLRAMARGLSPAEAGTPPAARNVIPVSSQAFRRIDRDVFADPQAAPAEYLAGAYSLPQVLAGRWLAQASGDVAPVIRWAAHANTSPPLIVRVNRLRASVDEALASLAGDGASAVAHANGRSVVFTEPVALTELSAFRSGWIQPQDTSATEVALAAAPQPGMNVLDLCAAPGTKTMHLAELMENRGAIVAVDVSDRRCALIADSARRMGAGIVTPMLTDRLGSLEAGQFDLVLADVPCSNTGVLARRAEARWRFDEHALGGLVKDQKLLLSAAAGMARPGGRVVYSTCSMEPEECDLLAKAAAGADLGLTLESQRLIRPAGATDRTQWRDGGFIAVFRRT